MASSEDIFLAKSKVILLYILNKVNHNISHSIFVELVANLSDINYFLFEEVLVDLLDEKYILLEKEEDKKRYMITDEGKQVLNLSLTMLPGIEKLKIDTNFKEVFTKLKEEKSIVAEYEIKSDNTYLVSLKVIEFDRIEFEMKVNAYSKEQVQEIIDNWKNNATNIYKEIIKLLNNNNI